MGKSKTKKPQWILTETDWTKHLEESYSDLKIKCRVAQINDYKTYMVFNEKGHPFYENQSWEAVAIRLDVERRINN